MHGKQFEFKLENSHDNGQAFEISKLKKNGW